MQRTRSNYIVEISCIRCFNENMHFLVIEEKFILHFSYNLITVAFAFFCIILEKIRLTVTKSFIHKQTWKQIKVFIFKLLINKVYQLRVVFGSIFALLNIVA